MLIKTNLDILGELRRSQITVTALAEEMGWSRQTLSTRLNSRDKPDPTFKEEVLSAIARVKAKGQ